MDRHHYLIDQLAPFIDNFAEVLESWRKFGGLVFSSKNLVRDSDSISTGNAHKRDRAFTRGSGDRGDGLARDDRRVLRYHVGRSFERTSFSAAMHFRFCFIVPIEMRTHSGKL